MGKGEPSPRNRNHRSWLRLARCRHGRRSREGEPSPGEPSPRTQAGTRCELLSLLKGGKEGTQPSENEHTWAESVSHSLALGHLALAFEQLSAVHCCPVKTGGGGTSPRKRKQKENTRAAGTTVNRHYNTSNHTDVLQPDPPHLSSDRAGGGKIRSITIVSLYHAELCYTSIPRPAMTEGTTRALVY